MLNRYGLSTEVKGLENTSRPICLDVTFRAGRQTLLVPREPRRSFTSRCLNLPILVGRHAMLESATLHDVPVKGTKTYKISICGDPILLRTSYYL